jgi:hypothetical protein
VSGQHVALQEEKEALDDLSMELELADEDEPVLCVTPACLQQQDPPPPS